MKIIFRQTAFSSQPIETELSVPSLKTAIEKTRRDLEIAYAGFDNALDIDMIDSYIYEINSLQKRYAHLSNLAANEKRNASVPTHRQRLIFSLAKKVSLPGLKKQTPPHRKAANPM